MTGPLYKPARRGPSLLVGLIHVVMLVMVVVMMIAATTPYFFELFATLARLLAVFAVALHCVPQLFFSLVPISFTSVLCSSRQ